MSSPKKREEEERRGLYYRTGKEWPGINRKSLLNFLYALERTGDGMIGSRLWVVSDVRDEPSLHPVYIPTEQVCSYAAYLV